MFLACSSPGGRGARGSFSLNLLLSQNHQDYTQYPFFPLFFTFREALSELLFPQSVRVSGVRERDIYIFEIVHSVDRLSILLSRHFSHLDQVPKLTPMEQRSAHPQGIGISRFETTTFNSVIFGPIFLLFGLYPDTSGSPKAFKLEIYPPSTTPPPLPFFFFK